MTVHFNTDGPVALITLGRPESLNALDLASLKLLRQHLCTFRDRDDLRAAVITGEGSKAFCAGADLKKTQSSDASYPEAMFKSLEISSEIGMYARMIDLTDLGLWKPVIAAINGYCLGGGLELALQCDLRVASVKARFGLPEPRVASIPGVSGVHRLMKAVAPAHAMKLALTGRPIDAPAALAMGLVSDVFEVDALVAGAVEIAQQICENGPLAVQAVKKLARQTSHLSDADAQQITELYWGALRDTADRLEGRAAFADKRAPRYIGR